MKLFRGYGMRGEVVKLRKHGAEAVVRQVNGTFTVTASSECDPIMKYSKYFDRRPERRTLSRDFTVANTAHAGGARRERSSEAREW